MKTNEKLNALKEEVEALNKKLDELTEDELDQVSGGAIPAIMPGYGVGAPGLDVGIEADFIIEE